MLVRRCGPLHGDWHVRRPRPEGVLVGHLRVREASAPRAEVLA